MSKTNSRTSPTRGSQSTGGSQPTEDLRKLLPQLAREPSLIEFIGQLSASVAVPQPARAAALAGLITMSERTPLFVAVPTRTDAANLASDLACFLGAGQVDELTAWETLPFERVSPSVATMGNRVRVLHRLIQAKSAFKSKPTSSDTRTHTPNSADTPTSSRADIRADTHTPNSADRNTPFVVVASARALCQMIDPTMIVGPISVSSGGTIDISDFVERLVGYGYKREQQVERHGEIAVRGSIVDVYPSTSATPVRIDLWGDEIERIARFSVADQRTTLTVDMVDIYPAGEIMLDAKLVERAERLVDSEPWGAQHWQRLADGETFDGMESWWPWLAERPSSVLSILSQDSAVVLVEPRRIRDKVTQVCADEEDLASVLSQTWGAAAHKLTRKPYLHVGFDDMSAPDHVPVWSMPTLPDSPDMQVMTASGWASASERKNVDTQGCVHRISQLLADDYKVLLCAANEVDSARISRILAEQDVRLKEPTTFTDLRQGVVLPSLKLAFVTTSDVTGRMRSRRSHQHASAHAHHQPHQQNASAQPRFYEDLSPGSFVVHSHHGVARFEGMVKRVIGGNEREYLMLAYRGSDKLYVPSDQVDMVRQYTGGETPRLSRMGGSDWSNTKSKVRRAVAEVARDLVKLYQHRITADGYAFAKDTIWQRELEESFEHEETLDQLKVATEVKADMELPVPMDRLVVGDVGFGKTEIAVRAAFKAVQDNRQVAFLVPTTLLAHQHTKTLKERFNSFPVRVEMLSRFLTSEQSRNVVKDIASGQVDVVVGTHRLLSRDVKFKRLGLLVIDEEQRFGVRHKEKIKSLRSDVDVLTLTATPVPRTLEMSITGIRDLSLLRTPPSERRPILTYVGEKSDRPVSEAIRRELLRDGQVFYVHNRVADIDAVAQELKRLVPEAKVAVAHGQMDEMVLEKVVMDFSEQKYDVLVCTTIIESGIDMPTVNTLVVDRADRLGLGQLHQIRGRVGRAGRRAYAYLLYPPDRVLPEQAYERLKTIGDATELGSGYRIAMRDLEIRGAGNLLGEAQSGHIAAVGYDLYCQMVSEAVATLKGEPVVSHENVKVDVPVNAHIPSEYIEKEASRLEFYSRLSTVTSHSQVESVKAEWLDRFGSPPSEAALLLDLAHLRVDCVKASISEVVVASRSPSSRFSSVTYHARLSPVRLLASRRMKMKRLYGDKAIYKPDAAWLSVPLRSDGLRSDGGSIPSQLRKLIADIVVV